MKHNSKINKDQHYGGASEAFFWVQNLRGTKKPLILRINNILMQYFKNQN